MSAVLRMKYRFLNGNVLKIIAAISMLIDHMGLLLFPANAVFRAIGRLSMPIFAFLVAEGCRYTRDKFRHFILVAALGAFYSAVYYFVYGYIYLSIFTTFTLSILMIYALQNFKKSVFCGEGAALCTVNGAIFVLLVAFTYLLNRITSFGELRFVLDYGFWGCMLPVFAALCDGKGTTKGNGGGCKYDFYLRLALFSVGLVVLCINILPIMPQAYFSLIALVFLLFYNEKRGKYNLKYAFYLFYPLHMGILFLISMFVNG